MHIHLLHQNNIKGEALRILLENRGHEVRFHQDQIIDSTDEIPSYSPLVLLVDTVYLSELSTQQLEKVYNSQQKVILLGKLEHFNWYFRFSNNPKGFVCRNEKLKNLYRSINKLRSSEIFLSSKILHFLNKPKLGQQRLLLHKDLQRPFTKTELILVREIGKGKTSDQIAGKYFNSKHTINNHRKNIIKKLDFDENLGLIKFSIKNMSAIQTLISLEQHKEQLAKYKNDYR